MYVYCTVQVLLHLSYEIQYFWSKSFSFCLFPKSQREISIKKERFFFSFFLSNFWSWQRNAILTSGYVVISTTTVLYLFTMCLLLNTFNVHCIRIYIYIIFITLINYYFWFNLKLSVNLWYIIFFFNKTILGLYETKKVYNVIFPPSNLQPDNICRVLWYPYLLLRLHVLQFILAQLQKKTKWIRVFRLFFPPFSDVLRWT